MADHGWCCRLLFCLASTSSFGCRCGASAVIRSQVDMALLGGLRWGAAAALDDLVLSLPGSFCVASWLGDFKSVIAPLLSFLGCGYPAAVGSDVRWLDAIRLRRRRLGHSSVLRRFCGPRCLGLWVF